MSTDQPRDEEITHKSVGGLVRIKSDLLTSTWVRDGRELRLLFQAGSALASKEDVEAHIRYVNDRFGLDCVISDGGGGPE